MADQLKELNQRDQDENFDEPEQKRQKPDECENPDNTVETKKITNIYYDCLERIFDFLDLKSLLIVAQTCKRLQIAAAAKFGDEFGNKLIRLYLYGSEPKIIIRQEEIRVFSLKLCLEFLRCFGAKISNLFVDYTHVCSKEEFYLDQYINQYCADTLTSIEFQNKWQFSNDLFQKPFKNVETVEVTCCDLRNQLTNFVKWFPNLRHLKILYCSFDITTPVNVTFPHLEHLEFHIDRHSYKFRIEDAATLLQANSQVQSVKLRLCSELKSVMDAINANSLITKLEVLRHILDPSINVSKEELNRFIDEHPSIVELILIRYRLTAVDAVDFISQMKSLKRIKFQVKDRPECDRITQELNNEWKSEVLTADDELHVELNRE